MNAAMTASIDRRAVISITIVSIALWTIASANDLARESTGTQSAAATELVAPLKPFAFLLGEWTAVPGAAGESAAT